MIKWLVAEMSCKWNYLFLKCFVNEMTCQWNHFVMKWLKYDMISQVNDWLTKRRSTKIFLGLLKLCSSIFFLQKFINFEFQNFQLFFSSSRNEEQGHYHKTLFTVIFPFELEARRHSGRTPVSPSQGQGF